MPPRWNRKPSQIISGTSANNVNSPGLIQSPMRRRLSITLVTAKYTKITMPGIASPSTPLLRVAITMPTVNSAQAQALEPWRSGRMTW